MKRVNPPKPLAAAAVEELLGTLKARFEKHSGRHPGRDWALIEARLRQRPDALWSLHEMERTGGEPDVVGFAAEPREIVFCDCSAETPAGRRSVCYDREGLESRKEHRPANSAHDLATAMGVELMNEEQYFRLQELGEFDRKTSSWLLTPPEMRRLGGALSGERRYGRVFIGCNGAQSYYGVRAFRGLLRV